MAKIKNFGAPIVREPETAGAWVERKAHSDSDDGQVPPNPVASPKSKSLLVDPFPARQSDARVAGKTPRPSEKPGD
ncbi:hypothetical protein [Mesorhizobium sp. Root695]|uniref:hypothetical protein n=1 Tax=Mesorhizobium sp. Root695 TaxID=1736589 RepID=UPI000A59B6FC|nr:hypothetical protein [Mesorhizobium sp. Root695]